MWRFAWSGTPALRPENFWQEGCDDSDFGTLQVPGHMELQGYGQIQYINTLYPWDGRASLRPPRIDWEDCPVGSYVQEFDLDPGLRGKGLYQLPGGGAGVLCVAQRKFCGLRRGQLHAVGI